MRYKLDRFYFDSNSNVLNKESQEVLLEPKVADLLSYFCQNPQRAISRDELIEHVWHGQVVSDSAVNRIIVKLRKGLDDNEKIKRFIITVPKVGYRLAIEAVQTSHEDFLKSKNNLDYNPVVSTKNKSTSVKLAYLTLCVVVIFATLLFSTFQSEETTSYADAKISPLLRLSTTQSQGAMSVDQRYLAFSVPVVKGGHQLHVKDNVNDVTNAVSPVDGAALMPYWSDDGQYLFYVFYRDQQCEIHQLTLGDGVFSTPNVIYQCSGSQVRTVVHLPKEQKLLFVEQGEDYAPWQVYSLSLNTGTKRKLAQPVSSGQGNYYLDRERKTNRILLLNEPNAAVSQVFELNITENTYHNLLTLNYKVDSALWAYDLNSIVHPGEHPSYDLVSTNLITAQQQVLYSDSRRIRDVNRINNGKDYLFTSYILNRDIMVDGEINVLSNSSVMDYLPAISNNGEQLAFISKRSGYSKLWLQKMGSSQLQSIELEEQGHLFYQLVWSYDDKWLMANTDKGIVIYDIEQGGVHKTIPLASTVVAVGWYSDDNIHYSEWLDQGWQIKVVNLQTNQTQLLDKALAFMLADKVDGAMQYLHFDQQLALNWQGRSLDTNACSNVLNRYRLTWKFNDNHIYCRNTERNAILALDQKGQVSTVHQATFIPPHFTLSGEHWATWKVSSYVSDLIRTNFSEGS